jgi:hypothetical protein
MGEATNGVIERARDPNEGKSAAQLEEKVGLIREHLTDVVSELDFRRHELMDMRGQLRRHAGLIAGIVGGALLITGGIVSFSVYRAKKRPKVVEVERKQYEGVLHRVLTAAAGAVVAVVARSAARRLIAPAIEAGRSEELPALPD